MDDEQFIKEKLAEAERYYKQKKYHQVVDVCTLILARDRKCFAAYHERSFALYSLGRDREAFADVDCMISLRPNSPGPYFERGIRNLSAGYFVKAVQDFNFVIDTEEEYFLTTSYFHRAIAHSMLGDKQACAADCAKIPNDFSFFVKLPNQEGRLLFKHDILK